MSLNDTMTSLMNAVRGKYGLKDKLSISDATKYIANQPETANVLNDLNINLFWNNARRDIKDGIVKFTGTLIDQGGHTGGYWFYPSNFVKNKRYRFHTLIRGNCNLVQIGEELDPQRCNVKLDPTRWQALTYDFVAQRDLVVYCKTASKGEWFEVKDYYLSEL